MSNNDVAVAAPQTAPGHRFWAGRSALIMPVLLVVLGIFLIAGINDMEVSGEATLFGPQAFPWITAGGCFIVAILLTISILRNPEIPEPHEGPDGQHTANLGSNWTAVAITLGSFIAFAVLLQPAGWIISAALVFWGLTVGLGSTRYVLNLLIGLAASSIMQLVFAGMLGLNLPAGVMGMF